MASSATIETEARAIAHPKQLYWLLLLGSITALGVALRLWGYFEYEFWFDEARWASRILRSIADPTRPIGYSYVSQLLAQIRNVEPVIRLPSLIAGVASLPLLVWLCASCGLSRGVQALGLFILAIHPWAVTASKEFKPYGLELALHLGLLALAASYLKTRKTRDLVWLTVVALLSTTLAFTVAMLLPWILLMVFVVALRDRHRKHAVIAFIGGALTACSLAAIYFMRIRGTERMRTPSHFGKKYDVFYMGKDPFEHAEWLLRGTAEVATFPAQLRMPWALESTQQVALGWLHIALAIAGCVYLFRKRAAFGIVALLATWGTAIALAATRVWPYTIFRTNLYLLAYALLIVLFGVQYLWDVARKNDIGRKLVLTLAATFVLVAFPYRFSVAAQKYGAGWNAAVRESLEIIRSYEEKQGLPRGKRKPFVVLDSLSCGPLQYYRKDHAETRTTLAPFIKNEIEAKCVHYGLHKVKRAVNRARRRGFWLISSKGNYLDPLEQHVRKRCEPDVLMRLHDATLLAHCPPAKKASTK